MNWWLDITIGKHEIDCSFQFSINFMELGIMTFADMQPESLPGRGMNAHQRLKELIEEIKLADQLGLDVFGIGEHHRPDYAVSSPAIILAAGAMVTKNIKLTSAVTVLSSDEPVSYTHLTLPTIYSV